MSISTRLLIFVFAAVASLRGQQPNWTNLAPATQPAARDSYAMAYDPVRAVTVLYGGAGFGDTWTFAFPSQWTQKAPATLPPARKAPSMVWFSSQNNMVLFGGLDVNGVALNQTWVWNGVNWTQKFPATSPPARAFAGMAEDAAHQQVVLFGGGTAAGFSSAMNDTWVWDGTNWTQKSPAATPAGVYVPSMSSGQTGPVLFGGQSTGGELMNQTWVWDGTNWNQQSPSSSPSSRYAAGMVFDSQKQVVVLFGGSDGLYFQPDTWQWNGTNWAQLSPSNSPGTRANMALAYDSGFRQTILFGGANLPSSDLADTWALGGPATPILTLPNVPSGVSYSANIGVVGGTPPYTITQTGTPRNLPVGLSLNSTTGQITGATEAAGTYQVGISVVDSQGLSVVSTFSLRVTPATALSLSPSPLPNATLGTPYSVPLTPAGGVPPYTLSATGLLGTGLSLNGSTLTGTCTSQPGNVSITVTDSAAPVANGSSFLYNLQCNAAPAITTASPLPVGVVNLPYTATLQRTGGTAPITWTLTPGTLPNGFALSQSGVLTGTPTAAMTSQFSVTITDLWGATDTKPFTVTFDPVLTITTASLPNGTSGAAYPGGISIVAAGGSGPGTYVFSATGLPVGFSINAQSGAISGTTFQSGPFSPKFRVTDQDAQIATRQIDLTILAGTGISFLSPPLLPNGNSGVPYSYQILWTGGVPTYNVAGTGLPQWLQVNQSTGLLTGTPPAGGAYSFLITVTDSKSPTHNSASMTFTIVVNAPTITTTSPLTPAIIGVPYSANLAATGGTPSYSWTSPNLPAFLNLTPGGALTGTAPVGTPPSVTFDVTVTDSLGAFTTRTLTLPVQVTPSPIFVTTSPLPPATVGVLYTTNFQAIGGSGGYTFTPYVLPPWLSLTTSGVLSGTPPSAGPVSFQVTVTDSNNQSLSQFFTLPVNAVLTIGTTSPLPNATVGLPYTDTFTASGGTGNYSWSATGQPLGLSMSPAGVLSGTPLQAGSVSFTVTVNDTVTSVSQPFTLTVDSVLNINTASPLPPATLNFPYTVTFAASGGAGSYQWTATGLPTGFGLTLAGVLTGTPQTAAPISFNVKVTDASNNNVTKSFTLPVNSTLTITNTSPLPQAVPQNPYTANFTASGGVPGYTWSATGLPTWLTLTTAGFLSGTPPSGSSSVTFQATVKDSANNTSSGLFTLPVAVTPVITTTVLPVATVNVQYSTTLSATGLVGTPTWSATGLPTGLTLSPAGVLSGTVSTANLYTFPVKVVDSQNSSATATASLLVTARITPLFFVTQNLAACVANTYCQNQIVVGGGTPPYTFSTPPNSNLGAFSLSSSGLVNGTPTSEGQTAIPVIVTDLQGATLSTTFTQTVFGVLTVSASNLPSGIVNVGYSAGLALSGGQAPYVWSVFSGSLPPGLLLDSQRGIISGTPSTAGTYSFSIRVKDFLQTSVPQPMSIVIDPVAVPLSIVTRSPLPAGVVGTAYSQNLQAAGGKPSYTWTMTGGALPLGLTFGSNGAISGTPLVADSTLFTVKVTDIAGSSQSATFSLTVTTPPGVTLLTPSPLPDGAVGVSYNYGIAVTGGTPPYYWSIIQGQLAPGLAFDNTSGIISGTPTAKGNFTIVVKVVDSIGQVDSSKAGSSATGRYTLRIVDGGDFQLTVGSTLPDGTVGQAYSTTLPASGGAPPYKWQLLYGTLPAGLTLDLGGKLSGTPVTAGAASLLIQAVDTTGAAATGAFLLKIVDPAVPSIVLAAQLPNGTVGIAYQAGFSAAGGQTPYGWSIQSGGLPPGLSLNGSTGAITGTPTQPGNFPFTVQVADGSRVTARRSASITVNAATLTISPSTVPGGAANVPYVFGLSVKGGVAPYTWSLSAGGLLTGFSIDPSSGLLSGTPAAPGTFPFTISVVDSTFHVGSQPFQLTVLSAGMAITTSSTPAATLGSAYTLGFQAVNASPPLTWTVVSGGLPPGITLDGASGALSGTPTSVGSFTFTVQVQDVTTATARANFTLAVNPPPISIVTTSVPVGSLTSAYSQKLQTSGGQGSVAWSVTSGALPPGLSLDPASGVISGTPTTPGTYSFTVQAIDSTGTAKQNLTLTIAGPPPAPPVTLSGLSITSVPGDQPSINITLGGPYPLPILVTALLTLTPNRGNATDLMFSNGSRSIQFTIPANATQVTLPVQLGTLPGTVQVSLTLSAGGVNITPTPQPAASTTIPTAPPVIRSITVTAAAPGLQIALVGTSTTLDMKTATFHFTAAPGSNLQTSDITVDVSGAFTQWYQNPTSLATGSQFSLTVPFTISGNLSTIASVSVTLTNSAGTSNTVSANIP